MVTTEVSSIATTANSETKIDQAGAAPVKSETVAQALSETPVFASEATQQSNSINRLAEKVYDTFFGSQPDPTPRQTLTASVTDKGKVLVETADGYKVRFEGENQEWWVIAPDGNKTRIWGDPHVEESDGTNWDFTEKSSFQFGQNKITVETIPTWNGKTFSRQVSIYNGDDRFTLSGIATDELKFESWSFDAKSHDAKLSDGTVYKLVNDGDKFSWQKQ